MKNWAPICEKGHLTFVIDVQKDLCEGVILKWKKGLVRGHSRRYLLAYKLVTISNNFITVYSFASNLLFVL